MGSASRQPPRFAKSWLLAVPFALLPSLVALIHLAPGVPPAPIILARVFLLTASVSLLACFILSRVAAPHVAVAAVGLAMSVFALFPSAQELFHRLVTPAHGRAFSLFYLLACAWIAISVLRTTSAQVMPRYAMVRRMAVLLTALIPVLLVYYYWIAPTRSVATLPESQELRAVMAQSELLPDVYHIVLDGFGRPDVLAAMYDLDLSSVLRELQGRGFEIAERSGATNYPQTYLSLASLLNMQYLDSLSAQIPDSLSRVPLNDLIQRSSVIETFKRLDYEIVFFGSDYSATYKHRLADRCECELPWVGEFESMIIQSTPFEQIGLGGVDYRPHRNRVRRTFDMLAALPPSERPRFVFAHIMAPHPPFVFDAQGRDVAPRRSFSFDDGSMYRGTAAEYQTGYRDQVQHIASRLLQVLEHLEQLSKVNRRGSVIIVHGDHGPRQRFHAIDVEQTDPIEALPVLLAIRWAQGSAPDQAVTSLVNIYRAFFRRYSNADLQPLPDRSFVSSFQQPYQFHEIDPSVIGGR